MRVPIGIDRLRRGVGCVASALVVSVGIVAAPSVSIGAQARQGGLFLGAKNFVQNGIGWGTPRPRTIFNGGDPSGEVTHIRWTSWGGSEARGYGLNAIFKPEGGYYRRLVRIELRASRIGRCRPGGPRAYLRLSFREPSRPGGPPGPWTLWSGQRNLCHYG